jgi:hypothetical protein
MVQTSRRGMVLPSKIWIYEHIHHFEFYVKACSKLNIYLSPLDLVPQDNVTSSEGYEIVLGYNRNTVLLRKNPGGVVVASSHLWEEQGTEVLNCNFRK